MSERYRIWEVYRLARPLCATILRALLLTPALLACAAVQAQSNEEVVERWFRAAVQGLAATVADSLSNTVAVHSNGSTVEISRAERVRWMDEQMNRRAGARIQEFEMLSQRDKVIVIFSIQSSAGPVSGVQAFRIEEGQIREIWASTIAEGVSWTWDEAVTGDTDREANTAVIRRWYEEIYAKGDWTLVPEVSGPTYLRHEDREFEMTGAEYAQRLRAMFERTGPMKIEYEVIADKDKVAVIARLPAYQAFPVFVQAWRVRNDRLVESWWGGPYEF